MEATPGETQEQLHAPGADPPPAAPPADGSGTFRRLGSVGPLAIAASVFPLIGFVTVLSQLNNLAPWLKSHAETGVAIYIALFIVLAGIALLPTHAAAILGGWAFGFSEGYPAAMAGFLGGALVGYGIARPAAGRRVVDLIDEHPKWKAVYVALLGSGFWKTLGIVALLRLPPNSPFAITNLVLAATRVALIPYALGTLIGMAPRIGLVVWLSSHASQLDLGIGKDRWILVGGAVIAILVLAIIGTIAKRAVARVTQTHTLPL
jgi:uncharacterized membrane protein YdjX (TVP38/TMEM64 family)